MDSKFVYALQVDVCNAIATDDLAHQPTVTSSTGGEDVAQQSVDLRRSIRKLPDAVILKIAAGEVVVRPVNAVKEVIENSLDAGSTKIDVTVRDGGLKQIIVRDNGSGIRRDDLARVCERHTTSKITNFNDLLSLNSFGFRGEALASISQCSRITVVSKALADEAGCSYKATYIDGCMQGPAKPVAGTQGVCITIEDLFYNNPLRQQSSNSRDEYIRVHDTVAHYAIDNCRVAFSLSRSGGSGKDAGKALPSSTLLTQTDLKLMPSSNPNAFDVVKAIYGEIMARSLVAIDAVNDKYHANFSSLISKLTYSQRRLTAIIFVNKRLVQCPALTNMLESQISVLLPKNCHPFAYISLNVLPQNIDVNVHPTKAEVHFLHEDSIVQWIGECIMKRLMQTSQIGTELTQTSMLPFVNVVPNENGNSAAAAGSSQSSKDESPGHARKKVRMDYRDQLLDAYFSQNQPSDGVRLTITPTKSHPNRRSINLRAVVQVRDEIKSQLHTGLKKLFQEHIFVGAQNESIAFIQHKTSLYAINVTKLSQILFYQMFFQDFANFDCFKLSPPPRIYDLAVQTLRSRPHDIPADELNDAKLDICARKIEEKLKSHAALMADYFYLQLSDAGEIISIPSFLTGYLPPLHDLGSYVVRLATEVDWTNEQSCYETFGKITGQFYAFRRDLYAESLDRKAYETAWRWTQQHVIMQALRNFLDPPKGMLLPIQYQQQQRQNVAAAAVNSSAVESDGVAAATTRNSIVAADDDNVVNVRSARVIQLLTSVEELYKVFERC